MNWLFVLSVALLCLFFLVTIAVTMGGDKPLKFLAGLVSLGLFFLVFGGLNLALLVIGEILAELLFGSRDINTAVAIYVALFYITPFVIEGIVKLRKRLKNRHA